MVKWFGLVIVNILVKDSLCWDVGTASWVFTSTLESLKCLAQGHYTAVVGNGKMPTIVSILPFMSRINEFDDVSLAIP